MLTSLLKNKRTWAFVGGLLTAKVLKSNTMHDFAVKTMAESMKIQKSVKETIQNIKEEAEDMCYDEEEATVVEA